MSKLANIFNADLSRQDIHHYQELARLHRAEAFNEMFAAAGHGIANGLAAAGRGGVALARAIRRWQRRRAAIRELESLSDRTLNDIGVVRGQIRSLVDARFSEARTASVTRLRVSGSSAAGREDEHDWQRAA